MSLVNLSHVCSHLQNCSKARLGVTSVVNSKMHLNLALALQKSGFLSTVTRGGANPPALLTATSIPQASDPELLDPSHPDTAIVTQANVSTRRLWLGLKYWKEKPVITEMSMESKPKARKTVQLNDLRQIIRGKQANYVRGLTRPGECLFLATDKGILESREAVERSVGGLLLCRVL